MSAHRAALDHVMTVIAESSWAERMVLRGSMTMPAWIGDAARPPGDIDWMIPQPGVPQPNRWNPDPYHDTLKPVQEWPEAVHGAVRNEMWEFEDFDTRGRHPRIPPDGLHWMPELDQTFSESGIAEDLQTLIADNPWTPDGIMFAPGEISATSDWDYADYADYDDAEPSGESGRVRIQIPWRTPDFDIGSVHVDVSFGERLPEPPVCTAIPRTGGLPPLGLWTPSRELSLAWKLHWVARDQHTDHRSAMKDVYDAVLLAESPGMRLRPLLQRVALGTDPAPGSSLFSDPTDPFAPCDSAPSLEAVLNPTRIPSWTVDGPAPDGSSPVPWLTRLAAAVSALL